ncbi:hypothetical protein [Burkholderia ambifaria]|nr:hypothetical protein [Burkholderia ambifaria]
MTIEDGNVVFDCPGEFRIRAASSRSKDPAIRPSACRNCR